MSKYGIIPTELIQGYYRGLVEKPSACRFCGGTTIYINKIEHLDIAYCNECLASAPIDVWNGKSVKTPKTPEYEAHQWMDKTK